MPRLNNDANLARTNGGKGQQTWNYYMTVSLFFKTDTLSFISSGWRYKVKRRAVIWRVNADVTSIFYLHTITNYLTKHSYYNGFFIYIRSELKHECHQRYLQRGAMKLRVCDESMICCFPIAFTFRTIWWLYKWYVRWLSGYLGIWLNIRWWFWNAKFEPELPLLVRFYSIILYGEQLKL